MVASSTIDIADASPVARMEFFSGKFPRPDENYCAYSFFDIFRRMSGQNSFTTRVMVS